MESKLFAKSSVTIDAPVNKVWDTITNPKDVQKIMQGMQPVSDWEVGSELIWRGRDKEKKNDDAKGKILVMNKNKELKYTFFYPGFGYPDIPINYNEVIFKLTTKRDTTFVEVEQGDFSVFKDGESYRDHSQFFWDNSMRILKGLAEIND